MGFADPLISFYFDEAVLEIAADRAKTWREFHQKDLEAKKRLNSIGQ